MARGRRELRKHRREAGKHARELIAEVAGGSLPYSAGIDQGVRGEMRDGDVLLFRGTGLLSWLIRRFTNSPYSHAGVVFRYCDRVYCLESVGNGVRLVPVSRLIDHYPEGIFYCGLEADEQQRRKAIDFGFQQLSLPYDVLGLVGFALGLIFGTRRPVHDASRWFCSELVAAAYQKAGFPLTPALPCYASPADLINGEKLQLRGRLTAAQAGALPQD